MKNVYLVAAFLFCVQFTFADGIKGNTTIAIEPVNRQVDDGGSITTLAELLWLSENEDAWDEVWTLEANIDATETASWNGGLGFSPIGDSPTEFGVRQQVPFTGTFDGQGFVISHITINRPEEPYVGFFGHITEGTVINLVLENASIKGYRYVGGFVGYGHQNAELDNCSYEGNVEAFEYGGGFAGITYSYVSISNSHAIANVTVNKWGGGFIADNYNYSEIYSCYAKSSVSGNDYLGGFAGMNRWFSSIHSSYSTGNITNQSWYAGGFVGINDDGIIENSFSTGNTIGDFGAGGFAGHNYLSENADMGIKKCYSTGSAAGNTYVGGFIGRNEGYVIDGYFDIETSGTTESCGSGCAPGQVSLTGISSADFAEESNFINWDFENIWNIYIDNSISPFARPYLGDELVSYELNLSSNPEEAGQLYGSGSYMEGEEVLISAETIGYYEFDNWTDEEGNIISTEGEALIIMPDSEFHLTANFHSTVGIEEVKEQLFKIYPNPVSDLLQINVPENAQLRMLTMDGKLVYEENISKNSTLDMSPFKPGVYLINITTLNTTETIQLVKK